LSSKPTDKSDQKPHWTFLTNHTHVLICLARDPEMVLKDVAVKVGITERAVQRIVADLEEGGYLVRQKDGRRNRYELTIAKSLRHAVEGNCDVKSLVELLK
jgi:DNA-binding MarR family transcriptional regulator